MLSTGSSCRTDQSKISASFLPTTVSRPLSPASQAEQEAKIKAEKIKIAIEKIKEASVKKLFIKVSFLRAIFSLALGLRGYSKRENLI